MKSLEKIVMELDDSQLKFAFDEINEWRESGILKEGVVRNVHREFKEQNELDYHPIHTIEPAILYEIAKRHYSIK